MFRTKYDAKKKQWSGESIELDWNRETSLGVEILNSLKLYGSKVAQVKLKLNFVVFFLYFCHLV